MAEGSDFNAEQRELTIGEISDYHNSDILEILMEAGVTHEGDDITESDFEAIKARAKYLAEENTLPVETLFVMGYKDRMEYIGKTVDEQLKQLPDDIIQGMVLAQTGIRLSSEEIGLLRNSGLPFNEWVNKRISAKEKIGDIHYAIDNNDTVIGSGDTPTEALLDGQNAKNEEGLVEKSTD